jgi:hypothetical protein
VAEIYIYGLYAAGSARSAKHKSKWADPVWRAKTIAAQKAGWAAKRARLGGGDA